MSQQVVRASPTRGVYLAWSILAFLSLFFGLPALAVGTLASQILIHLSGLLWLNDYTIGSFGGAAFTALASGAMLVGSVVALFQGFILQRELHVSLHSWRA